MPLVPPLVPLSTGVVLAQRVVTLALEADGARRGAEGAEAGPEEERLVLLVPKLDGRYPRVGTVTRMESGGDLPNGVLPWYCVACPGRWCTPAWPGRAAPCGWRPTRSVTGASPRRGCGTSSPSTERS
jgi:hypothetical protein